MVFGQVLPSYYLPERLSGGATVGTALLGNLLSPGRGLFVFSPILLVAIPGFIISLRDRADHRLHTAFGLIIILHWLSISRFPHWWGGFSFGPRLMSDILPFMTYFIGFAIRDIIDCKARIPRQIGTATVVILALASVAINAQGALSWAPSMWSVVPTSIDENPQRLSDWSDLQFTRAFSRPAPMPYFGPLLPGLTPACFLGGPDGELELGFRSVSRGQTC